MNWAAVTVFFVALTAAMTATAIVRAVAPVMGLLDKPDARRKLHGRPIPLGGGLAVFLASAGVLAAMMWLPNPWRTALWDVRREMLGLLLAGSTVVCVGLVDDRFHLRGRLKLCGQLAAALIMTSTGLVIYSFDVFGHTYELGLLAVPFTLFWLLGAINAVNLLDGIDGLATVIGIILAATIAAMAIITGQAHVTIIAMVFAASLVGFLRFNFPPASIFLGDAGSMLIGLVVASLAIRGAFKGPGTVLLAAPLAIWTIPILDSAAAILRRKLSGRSIYSTDRGHLHHRLLDLLGSNRKVLAAVAVFCAMTSAATLVGAVLKSDLIAAVVCTSIVTMLVATGVFGRAELTLLAKRLRQFGLSLVDSDRGGSRVRQTSVRLQGTRPWETLWGQLAEAAEGLSLIELRLDVNVPWAQEGYHAFWERPSAAEPEDLWRVELPLTVNGQSVGSLVALGEHGGKSARADVLRVLELLDPFETQLRELAAAHAVRPVLRDEPAAVEAPAVAALCPRSADAALSPAAGGEMAAVAAAATVHEGPPPAALGRAHPR